MKKSMKISLSGLFALSILSANVMAAENNEYNVVTLSANGETSVEQDYLTVNMAYEVDGDNNKQVQEQLTKRLNDSISSIKTAIKEKNFSVKMGRFSVYPQYDKTVINTWHGVATIILEGKDFAAISNATASVKDFTIQSTNFSVSPEQLSAVKDQTVSKAIANFKQQAGKITNNFGFENYEIKTVNVSYDEQGAMPVFRAMANTERAISVNSTPVNFEAGKTTIRANVDGSVIMSVRQTDLHAQN